MGTIKLLTEFNDLFKYIKIWYQLKKVLEIFSNNCFCKSINLHSIWKKNVSTTI